MYHPLLDTFTAVADCGSFTKAAESLHLSPTAVMKQMNTLENHLNLTLIERTTSGVHLTPAGEGCQIYDGLLEEIHFRSPCSYAYL